MTNVPEGPIFCALFVVIPALIVSLIAAVMVAALARETSRKRKFFIVMALTIISLASIALLHFDRFPANSIFGLLGFLSFPLAVVLASLCFRELPFWKHAPTAIIVITFVVYNAEMALFYLGR